MKEIEKAKYAYVLDNNEFILRLYSDIYLYFDNNNIELEEIDSGEVENIINSREYNQYIGLPVKYITKNIQYKLIDKFMPKKE